MAACGSCASKVRDGDTFCGHCGAKRPPPQVESPTGPVAVAITNRSGYERSVEHLDPLGAAYGTAAARQAFAYGLLAGLVSIVVLAVTRQLIVPAGEPVGPA
jgi:hypothetical protein